MYDQLFLATTGSSDVDPSAPTIGAAPSLLSATADSDSIALAWTNNDTYTATIIDRKDSGDYSSLAVAAGNATSYDDTTAAIGVMYTYRVRGVKTGYPTPFSNEDDAMISSVSSITIQYHDNVAAGNEVARLTGTAIDIDIDAGNSTADQIRTAFNANVLCTALATCTVSGTGTNAQNDVTLHTVNSGIPEVIQDLTYTPTF